MDRGDGRLDLVLADAPAGDRVVEERQPLGDGDRVPAGPILVGQRDEGAIGVVRAGRRASIRSIRASSPATSGSSGSRRRAILARRIASSDSSARWSSLHHCWHSPR